MDPALLHEIWIGLRFALIIMSVVISILGAMWWLESRFPSIKRYPFRADLVILKGCPTIYQMVHIVIPARTLEDAQVIADQIGEIHDTCLTFAPELRL